MFKHAIMGSAAALALIAAAPAQAGNTALILWNGANPGDAETATGTGSADLTATSLDGVSVTLSFVNRETNPNGMTEGNINIQNTTDSVQTLHIIAGANGFTGVAGGFNLSATILAALGSATLSGSFFADATNSLNGTSESVTGSDLGDFTSALLTGPHSFSFNAFSPDHLTSEYGLAESLTLTLQPFSQIGVQSISMDASAVPEPGTWALMGLGFGVMALLGVKGRKNRLALDIA
jgi:hypothetical protein